jgi:antitoxin component YwqK of YwqJK toxin-antitoxin module
MSVEDNVRGDISDDKPKGDVSDYNPRGDIEKITDIKQDATSVKWDDGTKWDSETYWDTWQSEGSVVQLNQKANIYITKEKVRNG